MLQQQKTSQLLSYFGLSDKESIVLLELIKIGQSPISTWARLSNIKRSSMYVVLRKLKNLHLVKEFPYRGMKYVKAIDVEEIESLINKKSLELVNVKSLFNEVKDELKQKISFPSIMPKIKFYEGASQVESVYDEILKENDFVAIFNPERVKKYMPDYHFLIPQNLKRNRGKARELLTTCDEAIEYRNKFNTLRHQIKILPKNSNFSSDTIIAGDKIYMIGYGDSKEAITATEIWNRELADSQKNIFDLIWDKYK